VTDDDLRAERDILLQSLRDLEDEHAAGDLDDADYLALKEDYTARAAAVLRRLDAETAGAAAAETDDGAAAEAAPPLPVTNAPHVDRTRPKATRKRRLRTFAVLGLLAMASGGIGLAVAQSSGERLAGDEATGDLPESGVDRITRANALVSEGKVLEAVKVYDQVLDDDPENPVALAQRGWLISRVDPRLVEDGLAQVDQAIALDPTYADAHFFRGMILLRAKNEPAAAAASFQRGIDAKPDPDLLSILQQFKSEADAAAAVAPPPSTTP
jgi:tetratricopeptide (TPR) repeat protein